MHKEHLKWYSPILNREMDILRFGHGGTPILAFPSSMGKYFEWQDFGMVDALAHQLESGQNQLFCVDSVDKESLYNRSVHPYARIKRHQQYEQYIIQEVVPAINHISKFGFIIATGASFGAYHATNLVLKYPQSFGKLISLSGAYSINSFLDGFYNDDVYFSSPLDFMPNLSDHHTLEAIRRNHLIFVFGQDDPCHDANYKLSQILHQKSIAHTYEIWDGFGHDWPWWKKMIQNHIA